MSLGDIIQMAGDRARRAQEGNPVPRPAAGERDEFREKYQQQAANRDLQALIANMASGDPRMREAAKREYDLRTSNANLAQKEFGPSASVFTTNDRQDQLNIMAKEQERWNAQHQMNQQKQNADIALGPQKLQNNVDVANAQAAPGVAQWEGAGQLRGAQAGAITEEQQLKKQKMDALVAALQGSGQANVQGVADKALGDEFEGYKSDTALGEQANRQAAINAQEARRVAEDKRQEAELGIRQQQAALKAPTPLEAGAQAIKGRGVNEDAMMARAEKAMGIGLEKMPPLERIAAIQKMLPDFIEILRAGDIGGSALTEDQAKAVVQYYLEKLYMQAQ